MNENLKAAISEMDKSVTALYLELAASVADDVKMKWEAVKEALPTE